MIDKESLQAIREIMKEEIRFQNEHIDSKLSAMENRIKKEIIKDISDFHIEVISDIGKVDEKVSQIAKKHTKEIQELKRAS